MAFDPTNDPHRRYNPLTRKWVLCSPHRAKRPWQGAQETTSEDRPYDPKNYLLPNSTRTSGDVNPDYKSTFVFKNDFSALLPETPAFKEGNIGESLFVTEAVRGECRVVCFHPRHDLTIAEMRDDEIVNIVNTWAEQYEDLGKKPHINHVQIFENKGSAMGCSNPHPHGQIWSGDFVPNEMEQAIVSMKEYKEKTGRLLLADYARSEEGKNERVLAMNDTFMVVVPFWATWPFETMIMPRSEFAHLSCVTDLDEKQKMDLANIMRRLTVRYDNLFKCSFPYSMGIHQAPTDGEKHDYLTMHLLYYPPLLRSATVKKFFVGFELLAEGQRDLTAEQAADRLRNLPETHYRPRMSDEDYAAMVKSHK